MKKRFKIGLPIIMLFVLLSIVPYFINIPSYKEFSQVDLFPESNVHEVEGIKIHYRIWLPREESLGKVLLVHGLGGSTFSWINNVEYLRDAGYAVVAVDLPGFGYSSRNPNINHSQENRSDLLWQLLNTIEENEIQDKSGGWVLAGHSMGGGTVTAMAIDNPGKTKALVLVDGALFGADRKLTAWALKYPPFNRWLQVILRHSLINIDNIESFLTSAYGKKPSESQVSGCLLPLRQPGTERALADFARTASNVDVDPLEEVEIPILGIWGEKDTWVPYQEGEKIKTKLPRMELEVISDAAHCPMETHPAEFNQIFIDYLKKIYE